MNKLILISIGIVLSITLQAQDSKYKLRLKEQFQKADSAFHVENIKDIKTLENDVNESLDKIRIYLKDSDVIIPKYVVPRDTSLMAGTATEGRHLYFIACNV